MVEPHFILATFNDVEIAIPQKAIEEAKEGLSQVSSQEKKRTMRSVISALQRYVSDVKNEKVQTEKQHENFCSDAAIYIANEILEGRSGEPDPANVNRYETVH